MSAALSIKSKIALMMRRPSDLTDEEKIQVRRISGRMAWAMAAGVFLMIGWGYVSIFSDYPAGPSRDLLLEVCNAFTISLASGFVALRLALFAARLRPASSISVAILAGVIFFVGGNLLFDVSMRLKADLAIAEVRAVAIARISKLARRENHELDVRSAVVEASEYVRAFRDPARMTELHAEHDRVLRDAAAITSPVSD